MILVAHSQTMVVSHVQFMHMISHTHTHDQHLKKR